MHPVKRALLILIMISYGAIGCQVTDGPIGGSGKFNSVIEHYRGNAMKQAAARYLIKNMKYHSSFRNEEYQEYCHAIRNVWSGDEHLDTVLRLQADVSTYYSRRLHPVSDEELVSSEYLIWNIDRSFEMWETSPFLAHLSFEEFCEYVLPYKCFDGQPVTKWKEEWSNLFLGDLPIAIQTDFMYGNARKAAELLTVPYKDLFCGKPRNEDGCHVLSVFDLETAFLRPYDSCIENSQLGVMTCRSKGVPEYYSYCYKKRKTK